MNRTLLAVLLLAASSVLARPVETVLTRDGGLYAITADGDAPQLALTYRLGDTSTSIVVPTTEDEAVESDPRLAYDAVSRTLYVAWHRADPEGDEVRLAMLRADGTWSAPLTIAGCNSARRSGLELVLTHVESTTLVHLAWWKVATQLAPEYALVAFEEGAAVSIDVSNLNTLAETSVNEIEDTGNVLHPPLAMARAGSGVDVVFGAPASTALQRIRLDPRRVASDARLWKPGRSGDGTGSVPRAGLVSQSTSPVQAFLANGRIVLYTPDAQFRFVVFENGAWTPLRMIRLDETVTRDEVLRQLRKTIEEDSADDASIPHE